jgi:hypothetical protein
MTTEQIKEIERVYQKPFCEIEELEIPTYIRENDEREELSDDHIWSEILDNQIK